MLLRVVNDQFTWLQKPEDFSWLGEGEIPADPLADLRTTDNGLSLYEFYNEDELVRIIAAFAAKRINLDKIDYVYFSSDVLEKANLKSIKSPGDTPDEKVNELHVALIELSAQKVVKLAAILLKEGTTRRKFHKEVGSLIVQSISSGWIGKDKIGKNIPDSLRKLGLSI